jgi:hypothetical protein
MGASGRPRDDPASHRQSGVGQLSLVEHALCPLDSRASLRQNLRHASEYRYTDGDGRCQTARVVVYCPAGLSPGDEFYLWGLLALTFSEAEPSLEFQATPHFCLRKLGLIAADSKGGKSYRLFRDALRRLSAVRYQNERFYDPIRGEHRAVSFGFFSYSLPLGLDSSRAWRIVWDPLFFEYCQATASQLTFDLETYRSLDHASRRLFLLLSKVFWRRQVSPRFDVRSLAVNVLGFSTGLTTRTLKAKIKRCADVLRQHDVLGRTTPATDEPFHKQAKGEYVTQFARGPYFDQRRPGRKAFAPDDSPLHDPLRAIGFHAPAIATILSQFPIEQIQLWADVTLAAIENKGPAFFRRSPQAFFMDNIQHATKAGRTPPDWFWALRKEEDRQRAEKGLRVKQSHGKGTIHAEPRSTALSRAIDPEATAACLVAEMTAQFRAAGQSARDARRNAQRFAEEYCRRTMKAKSP